MDHDRFFQNKACPYFPCHSTADPESFNCLFCYCPLYALGSQCGGEFTYAPSGLKDCSRCLRPHSPDAVEDFHKKLDEVMELARKKD